MRVCSCQSFGNTRSSCWCGPPTSRRIPMTITTTAPLPQLVLRSLDHNWDYARWERLPDDGNRYEVLDGVLYMTTAPSNYHQWIIGGLWQFVGVPCRASGFAH